MYKKRKKKKKTATVLKIPRGGFAPRGGSFGRIPNAIGKAAPGLIGGYLGKQFKAKAFDKFIDDSINSLSRGSEKVTRRALTALASKRGIEIKGTAYKVVGNPEVGVVGPENGTNVLEVHDGGKRISGSNGLYTATEHQVNFTSGVRNRSWIKNCIKNNGIDSQVIYDTVADLGLNDTTRGDLVQVYGLNQKMQLGLKTNSLGFGYNDFNTLLELDTLTSNVTREQIPYAAIYELWNKMTITNMNKYVPSYVKLSLVKILDRDKNIAQVLNDSCNNNVNSNVQAEGAMPVYYQQNPDVLYDNLGRVVMVSPRTPGMKAASNWKSGVETLTSKTVKLAAGDRLKVDYTHYCGSGLRLDKFFGIQPGEVNLDHNIIYSILIEAWGEEVDARSVNVPLNVIKGTAPGALQFEFQKGMKWCSPSTSLSNLNNEGTDGGFREKLVALKVFNRSPLKDRKRPSFGLYSDMNNATSGTGYEVAVMSDSDVKFAAEI